MVAWPCVSGTWWPEPLEDESVHFTETEADSQEGPGTRYNLQRHVPSDTISPARPHLLKSPLLPQRAPQLGARHSTCELMGAHFLFKL